MMLESASAGAEGLLLRAEPLEWAEEVSQRMANVERTEDDALLLDVDPAWAGSINTVLVSKGVRVNELRKETTTAVRPMT
jgi:hypothetical protein